MLQDPRWLRRAWCLALLLVAWLPYVSPVRGGDREAMVGVWQIVEFQDDGRDRLERLAAGPPIKDGPPRIAKLVVAADEIYVLRGDGTREVVAGLSNVAWKSCAIDESTTPKSIDLLGVPGKEGARPRIYPGIYSLDQDHLRICYCESGNTRPAEFKSDGAMNLLVCRRMPQQAPPSEPPRSAPRP